MGSFNYPITKMVYRDEFIADEKQIRSVLDYNVGITELSKEEKLYSAITGELYCITHKYIDQVHVCSYLAVQT